MHRGAEIHAEETKKLGLRADVQGAVRLSSRDSNNTQAGESELSRRASPIGLRDIRRLNDEPPRDLFLAYEASLFQ